MNRIQVKSRFCTPDDNIWTRGYLDLLLLCLSVLALTGCTTTENSIALAPQPPATALSFDGDNRIAYQPHYFAEPGITESIDLASITPAIGGSADEININPLLDTQQGQLRQKNVAALAKGCRLKDRFDRGAVLAYEWDRSRLSLDVDGLNLGSSDDRAIRVEYKIRLQPEKTRKQLCRYSSQWQGLIGSGYNEMFVREDDTVWEELREIKRDTLDYINRVF